MTIINDILDISKLEADKVMLEEQPFNLKSCIEEALDLVAIKAAEKGLNLSYTVDKNVPPNIIGDPSRLRQILSNLLNNAVKFTNAGDVKLIVSSQQLDGTHKIHFAVCKGQRRIEAFRCEIQHSIDDICIMPVHRTVCS